MTYLNSDKSEKHKTLDSVVEKEELNPRCPECGSTDVIQEPSRGQVTCRTCGLVLEQHTVDPSYKERIFSKKEADKTVTTSPVRRVGVPDMGLSTQIGFGIKDAHSRDMSPEKIAQMSRLKRMDSRKFSSKERNIGEAWKSIESTISKLVLPEMIEYFAKNIYGQVLGSRLIRGRSIEHMAVASVYSACRQAGNPRKFKEIEEVTGISRSEIYTAYKVINKNLSLPAIVIGPEHYIPRYIQALKLSQRVEQEALKMIFEAKEEGAIGGKTHASFAASVIYIASVIHNERRTQDEVAGVAGVTSVTIRNIYKTLVSKLNLQDRLDI